MDKRSGRRAPRYPSIRSALVIAVLLALIPAMGIITWTGVEYGRNLASQSQLEADRQAESFAEFQGRLTATARQLLTTLAALPDFVEGDAPHMEAILKAVHKQNTEYLNLTAVDPLGRVVASSLLPRGTDLSGRLHLQSALATRRFSAGQYILAAVDAVPSFPFALPLLNAEGTLTGAVAATFKLSSYYPLFDSLKLPAGAMIGLVDRNGIRVLHYHPKDTNVPGQPIKDSVWASMGGKGQSGGFMDTGSDGVYRYYAWRAMTLYPDEEPYLYVVYASPELAPRQVAQAIMVRNLFILLGVGLLGAAVASLCATGLFGSRLDRIVAVTKLLRDGKLGARLGPDDDSPDLGQICQALDLMADTVEQRVRERENYAAELQASLRLKDKLLKEVHHRVKNNLQIILSMMNLRNENREHCTPLKESLEKRIEIIALVHDLLYRDNSDELVNLADYTRLVVELAPRDLPAARRIAAEVEAPKIMFGLEKAVPYGLMLNELVGNAYIHAFPENRAGTVRVRIAQLDNGIAVRVSDDGVGMEPNQGQAGQAGIGLAMAKALAEQLGGTLSRLQGPGTAYEVIFPL